MSSPSPAGVADLAEELRSLEPTLRAHLDASGFDAARLLALAAGLDKSTRDAKNRVSGDVRPPAEDEIVDAPAPGSPRHKELAEKGEACLARGELAFVVLAGGMATRMGGVVKALVEAIPGHTFLQLRLKENEQLSRQAGRWVPMWLMTSDATDEPIKQALIKAGAPPHVKTFRQDVGLRLDESGHLFRDDHGNPSAYATGHGDMVDALNRAGLLRDFLGTGGLHVWMANLDNLGAAVDPALLGLHLDSGKPVQVEVVEKADDKGGIPVHAPGKDGADHLQVLEEFRLPKTFDPKTVRVFNTNTFLADARLLADTPFNWTYFEVEKKVDGRTAVQFERLVQEITAHLATSYVRVPRTGPHSRFLPAKDNDELLRRKPELEAVLSARGLI
jgi:UTP--glucose-1-phosphate uridylyltransferase